MFDLSSSSSLGPCQSQTCIILFLAWDWALASSGRSGIAFLPFHFIWQIENKLQLIDRYDCECCCCCLLFVHTTTRRRLGPKLLGPKAKRNLGHRMQGLICSMVSLVVAAAAVDLVHVPCIVVYCLFVDKLGPSSLVVLTHRDPGSEVN